MVRPNHSNRTYRNSYILIMAKVTKLAVCTPTNGLMEARTAFSLATALQFTKVPKQLFLAMGALIHVNRNMLVKDAIDAGCSHLLFVDTDMLFNYDDINRLIAHDVDIVGARYNKRILPVQSTVPDITEFSEVSFVPTGFLLINIDVFKKIGEPYFSFDDAESEDMYFCQKAIANGYKVYCDPTIEIGHLGTAVF